MMTLFRRRSYWTRGTRALSSVKSEEVPRAGFLFLRAAAVLLLADGDAIFGYPTSYRSGEFGVIRKRQSICLRNSVTQNLLRRRGRIFGSFPDRRLLWRKYRGIWNAAYNN